MVVRDHNLGAGGVVSGSVGIRGETRQVAAVETPSSITTTARPEVSTWVGATRKQTNPSHVYLSNLECEEVLKGACTALGITGYRLAHLLGIRSEHYSKWFSGSRRPSSRYFARLCQLYQFKAFGLMIEFVERIDWRGREAIYKKGVRLGDAERRDSLHKFGGRVSQEEG